MALQGHDLNRLGRFTSHHRLAIPVSAWERLKIGAGTPPIMTRHGWLILYHGVSERPQPNASEHHLCYSAGVMVLSKEHPQMIQMCIRDSPYRGVDLLRDLKGFLRSCH